MRRIFCGQILRRFLLLAVIVTAMPQAHADYRLDYVGNPYTFYNGSYVSPTSVRASLVLSDSLFSSLIGTGERSLYFLFSAMVPGVVSYSLSDGVQTFSALADIDAITLNISAAEEIQNWVIIAANADGEICSQNNPTLNACVGPLQRDVGVLNSGSTAFNAGVPGYWTITPVPEPEIGFLLILGLGVISGAVRLRKVGHQGAFIE